jgi:aromatic ring hydroxylase
MTKTISRDFEFKPDSLEFIYPLYVSSACIRHMTTKIVEAKNEIYHHCVATSIATANRIYDYRIREIDRTIAEYIQMIPENIRRERIRNFSN